MSKCVDCGIWETIPEDELCRECLIDADIAKEKGSPEGDCLKLGIKDGNLGNCPCGKPAELWQYRTHNGYSKGACCSDEDCPLNNPGPNFEAETRREAIAIWNKIARPPKHDAYDIQVENG
jgi:hypothetical protein